MSACVTRSLFIQGQFSVPLFCDWIAHRAGLLSLSGWVTERCEGTLEVRVRGNPILLEAMETACSLGPLEVQVESIEMQQHARDDESAVCQGFSIR